MRKVNSLSLVGCGGGIYKYKEFIEAEYGSSIEVLDELTALVRGYSYLDDFYNFDEIFAHRPVTLVFE